MGLQSFRELDTWKKAMELVVEVYRVTAEMPKDERHGLSGQMRRAAVSIPSNIAEGYGRAHRGEYTHHLAIARGSLRELETQSEITRRLGMTNSEGMDDVLKLQDETGRLLTRLIQSLR